MPEYFKNKYRIKSARWKDWDYAQNGSYFITICTKDRECFLGEIIDGKMHYSQVGRVAKDELLKTPLMRKNVRLDEWVIMPNHVHAIVVIDNDISSEKSILVETQCLASHHEGTNDTVHALSPPNRFGPQRNNLPSIVRGFKTAVAIYATKQHLSFGWQPRYYDRIIRNDLELNRIRAYIQQNPENWEKDGSNPYWIDV